MGYHDSYAVDRIQPLVLHDRGCHEFRVDLHSRNHPCQTGIESIDSDIVILDFHNGDVLYPYRVIRCDGNNGKAVFPAAWRKEILAFRIGNIGDVHPEDFVRLTEAIREIRK